MTVQQLYRLIDEGRLPAYRFGRIIRLRVDDLEAWERAREARDEVEAAD